MASERSCVADIRELMRLSASQRDANGAVKKSKVSVSAVLHGRGTRSGGKTQHEAPSSFFVMGCPLGSASQSPLTSPTAPVGAVGVIWYPVPIGSVSCVSFERPYHQLPRKSPGGGHHAQLSCANVFASHGLHWKSLSRH